MKWVFTYCGIYSLQAETTPVSDIDDIQLGDVFVKTGSPGHAMIVVDVAINSKKQKVFMLAQGYMPAQEIHIVKNPLDETLSPWFTAENSKQIITPQWIFYPVQLRRMKP